MEPCEELGDKVLKICLSKKCCLVYFGSEPILRLTGEKMCLAKIVSLSLPLNGKGASSDTTGNLNFETSFFGVVLCSLLLFEHSLYPFCPNCCRLVRKKKKNSLQEIRVVIIIGYHPLGAPNITETFLWMFVGSREMLSQESWVSFPAICPVRHRGFLPDFCHLFLLSTLSSNCHLLGLSLCSQSQFISAPQIMVKPASSPLCSLFLS